MLRSRSLACIDASGLARPFSGSTAHSSTGWIAQKNSISFLSQKEPPIGLKLDKQSVLEELRAAA